MSEIDKDDLKDEGGALLNQSEKVKVNATETPIQETRKEPMDPKKKKKIIIIAIAIVVVIGVILAIVLPLTLKKNNGGGDNPVTPVDPFNYQEFSAYGVDDNTTSESVFGLELMLKQKDSSLATKSLSSSQPKSFMKLLGDSDVNGAQYHPVNPTKIVDNSTTNNWAEYVKLHVELNSNNQARIIFRNNATDDPTYKKRAVDEQLFPRPGYEREARLTQLGFTYNTQNFHFNFSNIYTGDLIVSTMNRKLLITDKFSEIGFILPTKRCFGLGQRNGQFQIKAGTYTLHARGRDEGLPQDDQLGGKSGNHIHPFILCQTTTPKDFFGIFFVSTTPQAFEIVQFADQDKMVLNYIALGETLEMFFFVRDTAQGILGRYHGLIGKPQLPPYYAFGVFQGSNSYNSLSNIQDVFTGYQSISQAIEGVFIDNYNTQPHWSFTINNNSFAGLADEITKIHGRNQHVIFGASYALSNSGDNALYQNASNGKCLVNSFLAFAQGEGQVPLVGMLVNTNVSYLDPFQDSMSTLLNTTLPQFKAQVNGFDGLWIKDAHLPNQINGEYYVKKTPTTATKRLLQKNEEAVGFYEPYNISDQLGDIPSTYNMPFLPDFKRSSYLDNMTVSLNATHGGIGAKTIMNLYTHNGVAHRSLQRTYNALTANSTASTQRPLLFSESSWAGSGALAAALITDIYRSWDNLKTVISQALELSLYGMANTMVDVCGSLGPMDEELCARWMQLAAFMPLVRNYYNDTYKDPATGQYLSTDGSEPYTFKNINYKTAYGAAVSDRLKYSRYIYSQMYLSHNNGGSLVRPLFFDFPADNEAFNNIDNTYMMGDSIKVSPVLDKGKNEGDQYSSYFPAGIWYDLNDQTMAFNLTYGGYQSLKASFAKTNIHLKGGKIIPFQRNNGAITYKTTKDFETMVRMSFIIGRDAANAYADGNILIDDGISLNTGNNYTNWKVRYAEKSINFWVQDGNFEYQPDGQTIHQLDQIIIMNAADLNQTDFACYLGLNLNPVNLKIDFNDYTNMLTLSPLTQTSTVAFKDIGVIKFGNSRLEPNVCNLQSSFSYTGVKDDAASTDTYWRYNITNKQGSDLLDPLIVEFELLDDAGTVHVEITTKKDYDGGKTDLYRPPEDLVYNLTAFKTTAPAKKLTDFVKVSTDSFAYKIYSDASDEKNKLWESDPNHLYFTQYFIMDSGMFRTNQANGNPLLGMGERAGSIFYKNETGGIHSRYTFDQPNPIDNGLPPGRNFYGYQPFYAYQASTLDWFGVYDVSSYATDYIIFSDIKDGLNTTQIHKITIGGTINKVFVQGKKVNDLIVKFQKLVGNPAVPPLWAFGWHQCRFGYVTSEEWFTVYQNYTKYDLPLDAMWADIDYLDDYKLFTIAPKSYPDLATKVQAIKNDQRRFVPIMDAGVAVRSDYDVMTTGIEQGVFIMRDDMSGPLTAGVWPGNTYFPDFHGDNTMQWWWKNFDNLYDDTGLGLKFDGIWLDMNEATSFCAGYCNPEERPADSLRNKPWWVPGWRDLEDGAIGVDGIHTSINRREYDVHNMYSLMQTRATALYLQQKLTQGKNTTRPYVLSRSNYPGIGRYAHHWMGDNWSTEEYMGYSVDGVYSYQLFGLPFMGSDICGFNGDASPALCTKWHQLGSLYPFSRNHNQNGAASQEPYRFDIKISKDSSLTYTDVIKKALINRYSLIKYYYSEFHSIAVYGGSFFKPLFYEFQDDPQTFDEYDLKNNILLGDALKASINSQTVDFVTYPTTDFYFPAARWCQIVPYIDPTNCWDTTGVSGTDSKVQTLNSGIEDYYVHIRGGYIVPYQNATDLGVRKTPDLEGNSTDLLILPNVGNSQMTLPSQKDPLNACAIGYVYFDDGLTTEGITRFDMYVTNNTADGTFDLKVLQTNQYADKHNKGQETLGMISFLMASKSGMDKLNTATITVGGTPLDMQPPTYDQVSDVLSLNVTSNDQKWTQWTFWDFTQITLSTKQ